MRRLASASPTPSPLRVETDTQVAGDVVVAVAGGDGRDDLPLLGRQTVGQRARRDERRARGRRASPRGVRRCRRSGRGGMGVASSAARRRPPSAMDTRRAHNAEVPHVAVQPGSFPCVRSPPFSCQSLCCWRPYRRRKCRGARPAVIRTARATCPRRRSPVRTSGGCAWRGPTARVKQVRALPPASPRPSRPRRSSSTARCTSARRSGA